MTASKLQKYAAVILCGGRSSRMGFDKALLIQPDGRPLIAVLAAELSKRFGLVALACGNPQKLAGVSGLEPYPLIADEKPFSGPAGAVASVLDSLDGRAAFVMAGDMPNINWKVIEQLAALMEQGAKAAVPRVDNRLEPLYAFYGPDSGPFLRKSAKSGDGTLREAFGDIGVSFLDITGLADSTKIFANLNTPDEADKFGLRKPDPSPGSDAISGEARVSKEAIDRQKLLRAIPKVDLLLLEISQSGSPLASLSPEFLLACVRSALDRRRQAILSGELEKIMTEPWEPLKAVEAEALQMEILSLREVINATGVVIHTNLGRSVLAKGAIKNIIKIASSYSTLEYDLACGQRGDRQRHLEKIASAIFGAQSAMAVNNNAAALLLVAAALACGREIVISRGQLVEIGASFRLGEIMAAGGAILREVGATNRTTVEDYDRAVSADRTALILYVHPSNFRLVGYGGTPSIAQIAEISKAHGIPLVSDLGSGALFDLSKWLPDEPKVKESLAFGCDLITMSGDKLMGAGQAGLIAGRRDLLEKIKRHPFARAVRIDKLNLAALEYTLKLASRPKEACQVIPTLAMISATTDELEQKADRLLKAIGPLEGFSLESSPSEAQTGGGSAPDQLLPSRAVVVTPHDGEPGALEEALRLGNPPVIARVFRNRLWLDVRTVREEEIEPLAEALRAAIAAVQARANASAKAIAKDPIG
ncbi:MAG: L-seryl-tRNA(Sec) selenium transferase [Deltaproteobacteria bacterium]|jgi:L-seryl-tRNA(Ser) seleniumtransferase|nr:L-seryl-tRNA(Sec) selenium transferase [Deltaproteobacteria bacterium]